jgi:hypothetical protein
MLVRARIIALSLHDRFFRGLLLTGRARVVVTGLFYHVRTNCRKLEPQNAVFRRLFLVYGNGKANTRSAFALGPTIPDVSNNALRAREISVNQSMVIHF